MTQLLNTTDPNPAEQQATTRVVHGSSFQQPPGPKGCTASVPPPVLMFMYQQVRFALADRRGPT